MAKHYLQSVHMNIPTHISLGLIQDPWKICFSAQALHEEPWLLEGTKQEEQRKRKLKEGIDSLLLDHVCISYKKAETFHLWRYWQLADALSFWFN